MVMVPEKKEHESQTIFIGYYRGFNMIPLPFANKILILIPIPIPIPRKKDGTK